MTRPTASHAAFRPLLILAIAAIVMVMAAASAAPVRAAESPAQQPQGGDLILGPIGGLLLQTLSGSSQG